MNDSPPNYWEVAFQPAKVHPPEFPPDADPQSQEAEQEAAHLAEVAALRQRSAEEASAFLEKQKKQQNGPRIDVRFDGKSADGRTTYATWTVYR